LTYHDVDGTTYAYVPRPFGLVQGPVGYAEACYKGYKLRREREHFLWEVDAREDGGVVPTSLRCKFTNIAMAKAFIRSYLIEEDAKKKKRDARKFEN
jgi:hypothetical protein